MRETDRHLTVIHHQPNFPPHEITPEEEYEGFGFTSVDMGIHVLHLSGTEVIIERSGEAENEQVSVRSDDFISGEAVHSTIVLQPGEELNRVKYSLGPGGVLTIGTLSHHQLIVKFAKK